MGPIIFVTGNAGKVEEVRRFLEVPVEHVALELTEIQSVSSEEIVRDKAERAFREVDRPVLVEDVSFVMHALGEFPGPFIKWFEAALGNEGLCKLVAEKDRGCTARVTYGFHDGNRVHIVSGEMKGSIADAPKGAGSFGWAPIFIPEGMDRTYAELSLSEQEAVAMRSKALRALRELLNSQ